MIDDSLVVGAVHRDEAVDPGWMWSMMGLARQTRCRFSPLPCGAAIDIGRNLVVESFLKSNASYLLFIDSRHLFTIEDVEKLWEKRRPDIVISGLCRAKDGSWASRMQSDTGRWFPIDDPGEEVVAVEVTGAAFLLIGREVLEKVRAAGFSERRPWFAFTDGYGEDGEFCRRARQTGYTVQVDGAVRPLRRQVITMGGK